MRLKVHQIFQTRKVELSAAAYHYIYVTVHLLLMLRNIRNNPRFGWHEIYPSQTFISQKLKPT